jgi:hypothetical protein
LTLTFQSGLKITIPNHQLVVPDIQINQEGNTIFNDTTREVLLNPLQEINKNDMPKLGKTFLTSAYLNVNYDTGTFAMWLATPTTEEKLVGVGKSSAGCRIVSNSTSDPTNSTDPTDPTNPTGAAPASSNSTEGSKISTAAIAGIAIGATAGTAIVVFAAFWLMRWRTRSGYQANSQNAQQADPAILKSELPAGDLATSQYTTSYKIISQNLQEMPGDQAYHLGASRRM